MMQVSKEDTASLWEEVTTAVMMAAVNVPEDGSTPKPELLYDLRNRFNALVESHHIDKESYMKESLGLPDKNVTEAANALLTLLEKRPNEAPPKLSGDLYDLRCLLAQISIHLDQMVKDMQKNTLQSPANNGLSLG